MLAPDAQGRHNRLPASCSECKRRKQKCNREWPCNHCQARQVPHLCQFTPTTASSNTTEKPLSEIVRREAAEDHGNVAANGHLNPFSDAVSLRQLTLGRDAHLPQPKLYSSNVTIINKALQTLPPRPYTDLLVKSFIEGANFHYYILHPPTFLDQYHRWWANRGSHQSLSPELTCLVLRVCSCSLQYLDKSMQRRLEHEIGSPIKDLSERYHHIAQDLSLSIPPGEGGICQVQQLLLATYWFKSEARSVDSWHALGATIRMAQELEIRESAHGMAITEFEEELRRRTWCILFTWDWQMSILLSRPRIITSNDRSFDLPYVHLDDFVKGSSPPSPIVPMVLHCSLIQSLSNSLDIDSGILSPSDTMVYRHGIQEWMESFPSPFRIRHPDTKFDATHKYVPLQRLQLHTTAYAMMLHPLRQYLTKPQTPDITSTERDLYIAAVDTSLSLMASLQEFFDLLFPLYANFHSISCGIFDTAGILCLAIVRDISNHLPRREEVISSIGNGLEVLRKIKAVMGSGSIAYSVLKSLVSNIPLTTSESATLGCPQFKRAKLGQPYRDAVTLGYSDYGRAELAETELQRKPGMGHVPGTFSAQPLDTLPPSTALGVDNLFGNGTLFENDLIQLNHLVDWDSINL